MTLLPCSNSILLFQKHPICFLEIMLTEGCSQQELLYISWPSKLFIVITSSCSVVTTRKGLLSLPSCSDHEARQITQVYGFYDELMQHFGTAGPWRAVSDVFEYLPLTAVINNKIFCVHGGLSPEIKTIDQIYTLDRVKGTQYVFPGLASSPTHHAWPARWFTTR